MKETILTLAQAATQLGVSQRTIMRLMEKNEMKGFMIGKRWKFTQSEIDNYISRQQEQSQQGREAKEQKPEQAAS